METFGFKKTDVHVDVESLKTMVMQGQKLLDQVIRDCRDKSASDEQILSHGKRLQDKIKNGLPQINEITWKIERKLREETEGIIRLCSNSDDDFVSRVAKNLHAYAHDDSCLCWPSIMCDRNGAHFAGEDRRIEQPEHLA